MYKKYFVVHTCFRPTLAYGYKKKKNQLRMLYSISIFHRCFDVTETRCWKTSVPCPLNISRSGRLRGFSFRYFHSQRFSNCCGTFRLLFFFSRKTGEERFCSSVQLQRAGVQLALQTVLGFVIAQFQANGTSLGNA